MTQSGADVLMRPGRCAEDPRGIAGRARKITTRLVRRIERGRRLDPRRYVINRCPCHGAHVQPVSGNTHFWTLDFNFGREIALSAERRYWFGIRAPGQEIGVLWSNTAANGLNDASSESGTFDNWRQDSSASRNRAFRLTGY